MEYARDGRRSFRRYVVAAIVLVLLVALVFWKWDALRARASQMSNIYHLRRPSFGASEIVLTSEPGEDKKALSRRGKDWSARWQQDESRLFEVSGVTPNDYVMAPVYIGPIGSSSRRLLRVTIGAFIPHRPAEAKVELFTDGSNWGPPQSVQPIEPQLDKHMGHGHVGAACYFVFTKVLGSSRLSCSTGSFLPDQDGAVRIPFVLDGVSDALLIRVGVDDSISVIRESTNSR